MQVTNTRSPNQWQILSNHLDLQDKTFIDAGCGYADLAIMLITRSDARRVYCYETDYELCLSLEQKTVDYPNLHVICEDIDTWDKDYPKFKHKQDYLICFSVLPYMKAPIKALQNFRRLAKKVLLEVQYKGDGPGSSYWLEKEKGLMTPYIRSQGDMIRLLQAGGFTKMTILGETKVEGRNVYRKIWLAS